MATPSTPRRIALVTGASQGIGLAIALRLASDGYDLALNDLPTSLTALEAAVKQVEAKGIRAVAVPGDVSQKADVDAMVDAAVAALGGLDVLVANAGIAPVCPLIDNTPELWDKVMAINVRGTMLCYAAAARVMIKQGRGGRLIAACSTSGLRGGPNLSAYVASKFAVRGMNQSATHEFGKYGITCNVYCPTVVKTSMWEKIDEALAPLNNRAVGEYTDQRAKGVPLGRLGTPEDMAAMVSFLASKDASYISGQAMQVTGGDWMS